MMDKTEAVEAIRALYESLPDGVSAVVYDLDRYDAYGSVMGSWFAVSEVAYMLGECFEAFNPSPTMHDFRQQRGPGLATAVAWAKGYDEEVCDLVEAFAAGSIDMADLVKADRIFEQAYDLCKAAGLNY